MNKYRLCLFVISCLFLCGLWSPTLTAQTQVDEQSASIPSQPIKPTIESIDRLLADRTIPNCEQAIQDCGLLLKENPDNVEVLCRITDAYIGLIDIKTSALIEEKSEFKPLLREFGQTAYDYAKRAYKLKPDSKEVVGANLVSYGYLSASYGIVKAIFKGAAGRYKDLARQLIELDPGYLGGLGYRMLGKLYYVAPWPVGSSRKALKNFIKAVETDPSVLYAHYYAGVIYFDKDKYDLAEKEFTFVVDNPPAGHEKHYIPAYKKSAQEFLEKIAKIKADD